MQLFTGEQDGVCKSGRLPNVTKFVNVRRSMLVNVQSQDINIQRKKETEENFTKGEVLNLLEIFRFGKWNNFFRFFALHAIFNKVC